MTGTDPSAGGIPFTADGKLRKTGKTGIKLCGLMSKEDILTANELKPDLIGFVFAEKSKRRISREDARLLRDMLLPGIGAAGVFVDEDPERVAGLAREGIIDIIQLHGNEDGDYIKCLREMTDRPVIKAFRVKKRADLSVVNGCTADLVLLDAGAGDGVTFDWSLPDMVDRPYFLAGGLDPCNVADAVERLHPFFVDVSSGIETGGRKDPVKMRAFVERVREADRRCIGSDRSDNG